MQEPAFQDLMKGNHCWGCGSDNHHGLQIKSRWYGDESICTWQPRDYYSAGPPGILNGGVIASLIDCHCICTAMAAAYRIQQRDLGSEPLIWYATASLQVNYKRPTPIDQEVTLRARVTETTERRYNLTCSLYAAGEECASGEVVAVRVSAEWLK